MTASLSPRTLREAQSRFAHLLGHLLLFASSQGYELTLGDAMATSGHCRNSFHYRRLAIDLNLFRDGKYLTTTAAHEPLGRFWKSLDARCSWGGDFTSPDGNHYSYDEALGKRTP